MNKHVLLITYLLSLNLVIIAQDKKQSQNAQNDADLIEQGTNLKGLPLKPNFDINARNVFLSGYIRGYSSIGGALKINSGNGYIDIGPRNTSWAHIYTDRPNFIFNKPVYSMNGFHSYSGNLNLQAANGYYIQLKPRSSSYGLILREYNSNDYGNIEVTSAGLGLGYNTSGATLIVKNNKVIIDNGTNRLTSIEDWDIAGPGGVCINAHNDANSAHIPLAFAGSKFLFHGGVVRIDEKLIAKEIEVKTDVWSDFVFENDYNLIPLEKLEKYIKKHKHLPNVPPKKEVIKNGINVAEMNVIFMQKIEELTLYMIEQDKKMRELEKEINELKK